MKPEQTPGSLPKQLTKLMSKMNKWETLLDDFTAYALENDGVIDNKEQRRIDKIQKDIAAIKARILKIADKKGIELLLDEAEDDDVQSELPYDVNKMTASTGDDFVLMDDDVVPQKLANIINNSGLSAAIKEQLDTLFDEAEVNDTTTQKLNYIITSIHTFLDDPKVKPYYTADKNKAVVEYLKKMNINHEYKDLELAFKKYLMENGATPGTDDVGGAAKVKISLTKLSDVFLGGINKWIGKRKPIQINGTPCLLKCDGVKAFVDFAFEKNERTANLTESIALEFFRQTNSTDSIATKFSSGFTTASLKAGLLDFGWIKFTGKFDFLKLDASTERLGKAFSEGQLGFEWIALTFQSVVTNIADILPNFFADTRLSESLSLAESNFKVSIKFSLSVDIASFVKDKIAKEVKDKVEREILEKMDAEEKIAKKAAKELLDEKKDKAASKAIKESIGKLEKLNKGLKTKVAREVGEGIIKRTGSYVLKSVAARGLLKLIPIVNVISTIWDVFWIGCAVYNYFNSAPGMSEADAKRMNEAKDREFRLERKRDQQEENPREKRFVVLTVIKGLANDTNGQYRGKFGKTDWIRHNILLKFYEDSYTGGLYFRNPNSFKDSFVEEGKENAGDAVKIDFKVYKEIQLNEEESLTYDKHKMIRLEGDDMGAFMLVKKYSDFTRRMKLD